MISDNFVDVTSILIGITGNDPLMAIAANYLGNKWKARRERKSKERDSLRKARKGDIEGFQEAMAAPGTTPEPEPVDDMPAEPVSDTPQLQSGEYLQEIRDILQNIYTFMVNEEREDDASDLRKLEEERERLFARVERGGDIPGVKPEDFKQKKKGNVFKNIMNLLTNPTAAFSGAALGGSIGALIPAATAIVGKGLLLAAVGGISYKLSSEFFKASGVEDFIKQLQDEMFFNDDSGFRTWWRKFNRAIKQTLGIYDPEKEIRSASSRSASAERSERLAALQIIESEEDDKIRKIEDMNLNRIKVIMRKQERASGKQQYLGKISDASAQSYKDALIKKQRRIKKRKYDKHRNEMHKRKEQGFLTSKPAPQVDMAGQKKGSATGMSMSDKGKKLLKLRETRGGVPELQAYGDFKQVSIGYGTGIGLDGKPVQLGDTVTPQEAEQLFERDVRKFENIVKRNVKVPLTQDQFDALVSFVYNVGEGREDNPNTARNERVLGFKTSTMLQKLNAGDYQGASEEFAKWNKVTVNGQLVPHEGLENRRLGPTGEQRQFAGLLGGPKPTVMAKNNINEMSLLRDSIDELTQAMNTVSANNSVINSTQINTSSGGKNSGRAPMSTRGGSAVRTETS
jgi:lysozyme